MFEIFNAATHEINPTAKPARVDHTRVPKNFDYTTDAIELDGTVNDTGEHLKRNIISLVNINRDYYRCLTQIMDTDKSNNLVDIKFEVGLALKQEERAYAVGTEIIAVCRTNLKKIGHVLDGENSKLYAGTMTRDPFLIDRLKANELEKELADNKKNSKNSENKIAILEREKRDLLNKLNSYDTESVHRVSLEKRLKAEQLKNDKLRDTISLVFKQKMPYIINKNDNSL